MLFQICLYTLFQFLQLCKWNILFAAINNLEQIICCNILFAFIKNDIRSTNIWEQQIGIVDNFLSLHIWNLVSILLQQINHIVKGKHLFCFSLYLYPYGLKLALDFCHTDVLLWIFEQFVQIHQRSSLSILINKRINSIQCYISCHIIVIAILYKQLVELAIKCINIYLLQQCLIVTIQEIMFIVLLQETYNICQRYSYTSR